MRVLSKLSSLSLLSLHFEFHSFIFLPKRKDMSHINSCHNFIYHISHHNPTLNRLSKLVTYAHTNLRNRIAVTKHWYFAYYFRPGIRTRRLSRDYGRVYQDINYLGCRSKLEWHPYSLTHQSPSRDEEHG